MMMYGLADFKKKVVRVANEGIPLGIYTIFFTLFFKASKESQFL
jgi:hypothetical protein